MSLDGAAFVVTGGTGSLGGAVVRALLARADGVAEVLDLDGVRRVYAFTRLGGTPPSGLGLISPGDRVFMVNHAFEFGINPR